VSELLAPNGPRISIAHTPLTAPPESLTSQKGWWAQVPSSTKPSVDLRAINPSPNTPNLVDPR
jgi:hypothetical protein